MNEQKWERMSDAELEAMLEERVPELPPEHIVTEVTPWRRAMNRVLAGLAFNAVTLNFAWLNYILPAVGMVLSLLGFRALRRENKWFGICHVTAVIRTVYYFSTLILNTTIIYNTVTSSAVWSVLSAVSLSLLFVQVICFWCGLRAVRRKADLSPHADGAAALMVWYALVCFLAAVRYDGLAVGIVMIVGYVFIIDSLYKISGELDEAGYFIRTAPVRIADRTVVAILVLFLLIGSACGYLFGGSYPMEWSQTGTEEARETKEIRDRLMELGFPEYVLDDLAAEDIASCDGALQVVVDVTDVYDVKELRFTDVAVQIPGERKSWIIIHHFLWTTDPGFCGTESIQLWPAYSEGWAPDGEVNGRVLYDRDGGTFAASYNLLESGTYASENFWGEQSIDVVFAVFSMPGEGENYRGYVSYPITERQEGYVINSWIYYTHQKSRLQYPVVTAMENRLAGGGDGGVFRTIQNEFLFG